MKSSLIPYRYSSLLFLVLFYAGNVLANECRNYSFLNKGNSKLTEFVAVDELNGHVVRKTEIILMWLAHRLKQIFLRNIILIWVIFHTL